MKGQASTIAGADWHLVIKPNRFTALIAVGLAWLFFLPFIIWGLLGEPGPLVAAIFAAFPAVISYYGIKSALGLSGRIDIDSQGFTLQRPQGEPERFRWNEVQSFVVGQFAAGPVYDGMAAPHFLLSKDGSEHWLPGNTGLKPEILVALMEELRLLALAGWPSRPASIGELLKSKPGP